MYEQPVGFVGLGTLGMAMASRLVSAGHVVFVHNRTQARSHPMAQLGAIVLDSPAEVARQSRYVFSCLSDTDAVRSVYLGPAGLLSGATPGQVFTEHGTFAPELARTLARKMTAVGAAFLDAPVTGGPQGASAGSLVAMVGGSSEALQSVRELIGAYTADVVAVGGPGSGLELKLVNQLLVSCHLAAAAEAVSLIGRIGLAGEPAAHVLMSGWAASVMLGRTLQYVPTPSAASQATIQGMAHLQQLVADLAEENDLTLQSFPTARALFDRAVDEGYGGLDVAALGQVYRGRATAGVPAERAVHQGPRLAGGADQ
ncbi:MAG: 2-hydroxymethylglutarate dehydrogenase [Frankiales bacterium]|jgi:3-hydroxyisobutyrate dehydrogenase-like beta-hydroxyacid dehydrogenase|nr:2-hydroxymethylglutarate dehydrogenase [Frankiales bacterium]